MKQKWLLLTVVLLLLLPIAGKPILVSASDQSAAAIQVLVNGNRASMEQQPIIIGNRMFVPIRAVSNLLDANVAWDQQQKSITVKKNGITSLMTLNQQQATITYENGARQSILLDAPPTLIKNSTYVPIRFVSEALGASVAWAKSTNGGSTLSITTSGSNTPPPVNNTINLTLGSFTVALGDSVQNVKDALGAPDRIDKSVYNFDWYVYNSDYSKFIMIGIDEANTVRGFYTNAKGFSYNGGEVRYGDQGAKTISGVKLYRDSHAKDAVHAILVAPNADSAKFIESAEVRRANELQNWDATNAFRVNYGLSPLGIDDEAAKAATLHSQDMADQDYFSHTSLDKRSPWDRYAASKGKLFANAENIAAGYMLGIDNFDGWVNSLGHRKNILNETSTHLGVGSGYNAKSKYKYYYAQLFSTDK